MVQEHFQNQVPSVDAAGYAANVDSQATWIYQSGVDPKS